ncbi:MAG: hypothetical protein Kow00106_11810 [Anaerolineae bacterium]
MRPRRFEQDVARGDLPGLRLQGGDQGRVEGSGVLLERPEKERGEVVPNGRTNQRF